MTDIYAPRGRWGHLPSIVDSLDKSGDCWEWTGARDPLGYGRINQMGNGTSLVHRVVYEALVGEIPDEMVVDHICINPPCCNPDHLRVLTQAENARLSKANVTSQKAAQTECVNGHEFSGSNLLMSNTGHRRCRTCNLEWRRKWRANR